MVHDTATIEREPAAPALDPARVEAFAAGMLARLNDGFMTLGISVGYQTGLLDLLAGLPPSTSEEIARASAQHERYVREWLGLMVVSGIVEYEPAARTYSLPAEHAAVLTRAAGPDNLAALAQFLPLFAGVEAQVVQCFRNGGGVPYSEYRHFQHVMADSTALTIDAGLLHVTLPSFPAVLAALREGIAVLEIGCGYGHALNLMAAAYPHSRFTGCDLSEEAMLAARSEAAQLGLENVHFEVRDAVELLESNRYGLVTAFDVIHDLAFPRRMLAAIAHALQPGGHFLMVDIAAFQPPRGQPRSPVALAVVRRLTHALHDRLVSSGR